MTTKNEEALELAWEALIASEFDVVKLRIGTDNDKKFASYSMQVDNLKLKPWQSPPCHLYGEDRVDDCDHHADKIFRRMLDAGISIWHPDPLAALAEVAKKQKA